MINTNVLMDAARQLDVASRALRRICEYDEDRVHLNGDISADTLHPGDAKLIGKALVNIHAALARNS